MPYEDAKIEVLIVDDTIDNIKLLDDLLSAEGYKVTGAPSGSAALRICQHKDIDLILLDIMMPKMDGYEVCSHLKASARTQDIPIIFLSALDSTQDKVRAFQVGGVDYIQKPFEALEVLARVKNHTDILLLRRKLLKQNRELKKLAHTDGLTGLLNRRRMTELLEQQANYCVILFDVDNFKYINDKYGHQRGDEELIEFASLTEEIVAHKGYISRWGGEEFLVLLPECDIEEAKTIAQSLQKTFSGSKQVCSTASFGVVDNQSAGSFSSVVQAADQAMYQGKNQVVIWQEERQEERQQEEEPHTS
ncbi:diguanylate cyclase response regulator [Vibrio ponticus]|uniref:diguanylate cyclase n=1 Tax=Vibrio ponticus TaxID=265668 RepID=A0ABX3FMV9_9VIBR|nr:diguanylate cyclase [Vibrio ponticus]OLQ93798.1 diguanylate cyclase response regulator [Vibrio ponticus]